jgi:phage-related minor tail protein
MADRIKGITIEIDGDTSKLSSALKGVNGEIRDTEKQLKDINKLLKMDPGNTDLLQQKYKKMGDAVEETKKKLDTLKTAQEQMKTDGKVGTDEWDALQREIDETEQKLEGLEDGYKKFGSVQAQQVAAAGEKIKDIGGKVTDVGTGLSTHVTAPLVAVGAASTAAFQEVDAGLDIITKKTGASGEALADMQQSAKDLATEIPTDFETAGSAIGEVNTRFGLTGDALKDLSGQFIQFASLNDTDVSTSVDNVSRVLGAFGEDTSTAGNLLDALNKTGQNTGVSMDSLAQDLQKNAAQFKEMGLTSEQAAGFLGQVEMSGLDTSTAMMGLKTAMKNATKDGQTLDQALKGFSDTMKGNGTETEKLQAAYDLFGSKGGAAIYNAVKEGKLNLDDFSTSMTDFEGSVANTFNETLDPIDKFTTAMNALKIVGADIGASLMEVLGPVLQELANALRDVAQWWEGLPAPMQQFIIKAALVAAAVGPILVVVGKIISAVGTIMTIIPQVSAAIGVVKGAMTALNATMLANPIVLIIAAIAALVAAFIYLWNTNEGFRQFWIDLWEGIKQAVITAWEAIKAFFTTIWETIKGIFTTAVTAISTFLTNAWTAITTTVQTVFNAIKTFFETIWNAIKTVFTTVFTAIQTIVTTYFNIYKTIITTVLNAIKTVVTTVFNAIKTTITTILNGIKTAFTTIWNGIKTAVTNVINGIKTTITNGLNAAKNTVSSVLGAIKSKFSSIWEGVKSIVSGAIEKIKGFMHFEWSLPHLKLPHFTISGEFSLNPPSVPHFGIDWYKKAYDTGMILNSPTIFGASGNHLLGGGDGNGGEVVVGEDTLQGWIAAAVAAGGGAGNITIPIYLGNRRLETVVVDANQRANFKSGGR